MDTPVPKPPAFPFERECPFHPSERYAKARESCPVFDVTLWNDQRAWVVTRYDDIRVVLNDDRFSGEMARPEFPAVTEARVVVDKEERAFVGMDNPEHDRFRRMFTKEFSARRMFALKPKISALADRLIDDMQEQPQPADLVAALAIKFPSLVMCELFGSPYEDHAFIMECAAGRHGLTQSPAVAHEKARSLAKYMRDLIDRKEASPADDMISRIIEEQIKPGHLSRDEFAEIGAMILRAGHDTTTNMIGMGTLLLLQNDALRQQLAETPSLIEGAVEELLRFISPVQYSPRRVALEDVEVAGVLIRKGEGLFLPLPSANRDESVFPNPDVLDFERDASHHIAFGYGIHQCLGQILARVELVIMYSAILTRLPGLKLAVPLEEIRFKSDMQIYGVYNLPVTW
jgi:cytochrome P450